MYVEVYEMYGTVVVVDISVVPRTYPGGADFVDKALAYARGLVDVIRAPVRPGEREELAVEIQRRFAEEFEAGSNHWGE